MKCIFEVELEVEFNSISINFNVKMLCTNYIINNHKTKNNQYASMGPRV